MICRHRILLTYYYNISQSDVSKMLYSLGITLSIDDVKFRKYAFIFARYK